MRILLISFYFPPSNSIGTLRAGKTARYLVEMGHDVRVLTAIDQPGLDQSLPVEIAPERIHRVWWPTPERLVARALARRRTAAAAGIATPDVNGVVSRLGRLYRQLVHLPDEAALGIPFAFHAGSRLLRSWRPNVLFASGSPHSALIVASLLSARHGIPWVGELRDLWTDNHLYSFSKLRRGVESRLERRVLTSAAGLVTVSEPLAARLRTAFKRPTSVVLNGFDPADYGDAPAHAEGDLLTIAYTGQVVHGKQDPIPLLEGLRLLGPLASRLRVRFYGKFLGCGLRDLLERASASSHARQIEVHAPVTHHEALRLQQAADILLLLTWTDPHNPGVYTGKLFEYVGARRPILAIGPGNTVADDLIRERGLGASLSTPAAIARQLKEWLATKDRNGEIALVPRERGAGLTRRAQAGVLEEFLVRQATASSTGSSDEAEGVRASH